MLTIFNNKPTLGSEPDGDLRLDMLYRSRTDSSFIEDKFVVMVKKGEEMRPDILSTNFFGASDYYDVLLKYNGVPNPFSIDEGEVFFSPELDGLMSNVTTNAREQEAEDVVRKQYINPEKRSVSDIKRAIVDAKRVEALKAKAAISPAPGSMLPPNISDSGDREITIKGGKIYFGKDVVHNKEECAEPLSKSEFLSRLMKNRINKSLSSKLAESALDIGATEEAEQNNNDS